MKFFVALILISLFFALPISTPFWQFLPLPKIVQFPWRFLSLTVFAAAVLIGRLPKKLGIFLAILTIIFSLPFFQVTRTFHPESYYTTNDDSTTVKNEYDSKWLTVNITNQQPQEVVNLSPTKIRVYKNRALGRVGRFPRQALFGPRQRFLIQVQTQNFSLRTGFF